MWLINARSKWSHGRPWRTVDYDTKNGIGVTVFFLLETGEQQIGRVPKKVKTLWPLFPKTLWPLLPKSKNCWGKLQKNARHSFGDNSFNNLWRFVVFCYSASFAAYSSSLVMEIIKSECNTSYHRALWWRTEKIKKRTNN